ncbi:hypothetical protein LTR66_010120 [Elasticomyces elasticus]|nr:hypothetical protein LTR66_010120 [Elasticomyces elasticus]
MPPSIAAHPVARLQLKAPFFDRERNDSSSHRQGQNAYRLPRARFYTGRMPQSFRASFFRLSKASRPVVLALCVLLFFFYVSSRRSNAQPADISSASASSGESNRAHAAEDYAATRSKLAKVTMLFYDKPSKDPRAYESALLGHRKHDLRYGYRHFVLRQAIVEGIYPKHPTSRARETKDRAARVAIESLLMIISSWHDADLVLMNSKIPLDVFLPPEPEWSHIHLLCSNDLNGINAGVFFLRVHEWSAWFLAAVLSYTHYNPSVVLAYSEQTAMEFLARDVCVPDMMEFSVFGFVG